tara:strand:+ start:820 stop:1581 length:762 start_codon:yes stop_codon:yes gene_type:complete
MLSESKISNLVHASGYKISTMQATNEQRKEFNTDYVTKIEPISCNKLILKNFFVEEIYLDVIRFLTKYDHLSISQIVDGESGKHLLSLINKYGWMNWADESITFQIYKHLEKYVKKFSVGPERYDINTEKNIVQDSILDKMTNNFINNFTQSGELVNDWVGVMFHIADMHHNFDYSKYMGMTGFEEIPGNMTVKPYSLGASLIFFHKLKIPKYSIAECKICDDLFFQKRSTGIYCSNKCRVKNYKNNRSGPNI